MKELKSKKTGKVQIVSEEDYKKIASNPDLLKRFSVTNLNPREMMPVIKPIKKK